ncbi:hypothetical protein M0804_003016 [Polistes exclamans]|nr:hypothetical protein M0804_003016 [Polistes exclamans]
MKSCEYRFLFMKKKNNKMAESEKQAADKQEEEEEDISKSEYSTNDNIFDPSNEQINYVNYTHPTVSKKKGYIDLTNYKRNYRDMEARANAQQSKRQFMQKSKGFTNIEDRSEKRENGKNVSSTFTDEIDAEKYAKESKKAIGKITEIHESDKIDRLNATHKDGDVSMENIPVGDDMENVSEQTNILPEEAYIQHMERVIASNTLPSRNMEILENLYASYNSDKKKTSTIEKIHIETDVRTLKPSESKTVTREQMEQVSTSEKGKAILISSSKDIDNVHQSEMQDITENLILTESSISIVENDNRKLESLESDSLAKKGEILTSTPNKSVDKINATSNIDNTKNDSYSQTFITIENPFSDFTLQTVKLKTNVGNSLIEERNNFTDISENSPSNLISYDSENVTMLEESKIIDFSEQNDTTTDSKELVTINLLQCNCTDVRTDATNNENDDNNNNNNNNNNNDNVSIIERIRRYFLSSLIDYLLSSEIPNIDNKISLYH